MIKEMNYLLEYRCDGAHAPEGVGKCDEIFRMASDKPEWPKLSPKKHTRMQLHVGNYLCGTFKPHRMWIDYSLAEETVKKLTSDLALTDEQLVAKYVPEKTNGQ